MTAQWKSDLYIMSMVTDRIGWHSHYQLIIKIAISGKRRIAKFYYNFHLVDINDNFECDWLIQPSDNKLYGNNLASELEVLED